MVYKVLLPITIGKNGFDKDERQDVLLQVESSIGSCFWNEYLVCWICATFTRFSGWSLLGLGSKAISFTSCRATNDGKTCGMFANGRTIRASIDGKNCGILVGGRWLTFDGKTWGTTNDGKTCGTPIGGKKSMFDAELGEPRMMAKLVELLLVVQSLRSY